MWYCRMKMPKADRYKTVSLKTTDLDVARERAFEQDADIRFRLKHDVPVFNHPFREVGKEYLLTQEARAKRGEISAARPKKLRAVIEGTLDRYAGSTQLHLIGDERWGSYPSATAEGNAYIRHAIKIESGAKSALDPDAPVVVKPYIAYDFPNLDWAVGNVTTVDPSRTFWDKVIILHGLRRWWDRRGELKGGGQRVSRHYYDVYRLLASETGRKATEDAEMAED